MMTEEMMKQMPAHMMGNAGMAGNPLAHGAMMAATGFAAGRGLFGNPFGSGPFGLLRNPLLVLGAGVAAGYLLFRYEKEIIAAVSKATGMGKDFVAHQKEHLDDLIAESQAKEEAQGAVPAADGPKA